MATDAYRAWNAFLWRAWESLGVSSWERGAPGTVIDPEALLLATIAHDDLRLRGEAARWVAANESLVHGRRLRTLAAQDELTGELATWLDLVEPATVASQDTTHAILPEGAAAAALRLRALTGTTARAEVVRALHGVLLGSIPPQSTSELVDTLSITRAQVNRALADLEHAGFIEARGTPKRLRYAPVEHDTLAQAVWSAWHGYGFAPWLELARAASALVEAREALAASDSVATVAQALDAYERHAAALTTATGGRHPRHRAGSADFVADQLASIIDEVVPALLSTLDGPGMATRSTR